MSNLLNKASILTTATGYGDGVVNSIKPAYALGENLDVLPSADSAVGNHYKFSPYGNNTVQYVNDETIITYVDNTSGAFHYFQTSYNLSQNLTVGRKYKVEISFKVNTGSFNWQYNTGTSTISLGTSTNTDFQTITYSYTAGHASNSWVRTQNFTSGQILTVRKITIQEVTDADFDFTRNSPATRVNSEGLIESVGVDIPRIDYTDGCGSLLLEPRRTNEILHSNQFDTTWSTGFSTITGSSGVSPSGINNAWKVESTTVGAETRVRQSHTFSIGESVTISCFMKAGTVDFGIVRCYAVSGGGRAWFNLSNGTVGTEDSGITGSIEEYPNGWYRCIINFTTNQSGSIDIAPAPADNDYLANAAGENILIYGAQLETGSYATSYIPTSGSAVVREADVCNNAGNSDLINSEEGVLYCEIAALANDATNKQISISNGSVSQRVYFGFRANNPNEFILSSKDSSFVIATVNDVTNYNKYAFQYKSGNFKAFVNGVNYSLNADGGSLPTSLDRLNFDDGAGNSDFYGKVKGLAVYNEALSDSELASLTSI